VLSWPLGILIDGGYSGGGNGAEGGDGGGTDPFVLDFDVDGMSSSQ
jgi:hypothetical protein